MLTYKLPKNRKPLQPVNTLSNTLTKPHIAKNKTILHSPIPNQNKENHHRLIPIEPLIDGSLAEELKAMREKTERLRVEREKTEVMMRERSLCLERKMEEMRERGEVQKELEIQVDRLFRLNEIKSLSKRNSPIRSLREKEQGGKIKEGQPKDINPESISECNTSSQLQCSSSETYTQS